MSENIGQRKTGPLKCECKQRGTNHHHPFEFRDPLMWCDHHCSPLL